jgi:hypothetical protein
MKTLTCKRCGHTWYPRSPNKPKNCASCNSPYWDKERGIKMKVDSELIKQKVINEYKPSVLIRPQNCPACGSEKTYTRVYTRPTGWYDDLAGCGECGCRYNQARDNYIRLEVKKC